MTENRKEELVEECAMKLFLFFASEQKRLSKDFAPECWKMARTFVAGREEG